MPLRVARIVAVVLVAVGCVEIAENDCAVAAPQKAQCERFADVMGAAPGCLDDQCFCCATTEQSAARAQLADPVSCMRDDARSVEGVPAGACAAPYHPPR